MTVVLIVLYVASTTLARTCLVFVPFELSNQRLSICGMVISVGLLFVWIINKSQHFIECLFDFLSLFG